MTIFNFQQGGRGEMIVPENETEKNEIRLVLPGTLLNE